MKNNGFEVLPTPHQPCNTCPVRHHTLFARLTGERLERAQRLRATQIRIPAKHILFKEGDTATNAYTLWAGWIAVYRTLQNGTRQITRFALPGDFLGFQVDLDGPAAHAAVSITDSVLCAFPRTSLHTLLSEYPEVAAQMARINARYLDMSECYLTGIGRQSAAERIAFLLLDLYHRSQIQTGIKGGHNGMPFPLRQEEIADAVGLTTVHVNRVLKELREKGLIVCASRRLRVIDESRLAEIAEFSTNLASSPAVL